MNLFGWLFGRRDPPQLEAAPDVRPDDPRKFRSVRMFSGARTDRLTAAWGATPVPADAVITRTQRILVARSRERGVASDYGKRFLQLAVQNLVGENGVQLQAQVRDRAGALDDAVNDALEAAWRKWGRRGTADVTGRDSWRSIQESCVRTAATDGEFFVRFVIGPDAGPWGFALQVIDPQRCPVDYDVDRLPGGRFVRHGIEFSSSGRPVAYYFTTIDEGEATPGYWYGASKGGYVRVDAGEVLHGFVSELVGQKRGLPWLSTSIYRLKQLGEFEDAAVVNARIAASKMGFIEWDEGFGPEADEDEEVEIDVEAGVFREMPMGARFKEFSPQFPHGEYAVFNKAQLRGISAGLGVSYHTLAQDLEGVNFSSARAGELTDRDNWKRLQAWLIEQLVQPVYERWLAHALLSGRIVVGGKAVSPARYDEVSVASWQPRRWAWVDPRADVDASIKAKNHLFRSPSSLIREQGHDPQTVWREVAADIEAMRAAGIPEQIIEAAVVAQVGRKNVPGDKSDDGDS